MVKIFKSFFSKLRLKPLWQNHWKKILVVVALVAISSLVARRTILKPEPELETSIVTRQDLTQTLEVSGTINAEAKAVLKFQTGGKLAWLGVKVGDRVNQWQAVASLDKRILRKQLEKALNDYLHQRWDFDQIREDNLVSTDNYDEYSFTNAIERAIEQEQFLLNKTVLDVEIQDLTNRLASIVSPVSGIVISIDTPVAGVNITPADAITIVDPMSLYFEVEIDESDIGSVQLGQKAEIFLEAYPGTPIQSEIFWLDFSASTSDGGGTVFLAKLSLPPGQVDYRLGMNGDASVVLVQKQNALVLPIDAIQEGDPSVAFSLQNGEFEKIPLETGLETDDYIEIVSGLAENQEVISAGSVENIDDLRQNLRQGRRILRGR